MTAPIFLVAVCKVIGGVDLDDCEQWIADAARPDPSVIDMFCMKCEVSAWGWLK
jgi:hypothetical protein